MQYETRPPKNIHGDSKFSQDHPWKMGEFVQEYLTAKKNM